jgi:coenzyme F420-reducing hydrogenase delta subunit
MQLELEFERLQRYLQTDVRFVAVSAALRADCATAGDALVAGAQAQAQAGSEAGEAAYQIGTQRAMCAESEGEKTSPSATGCNPMGRL